MARGAVMRAQTFTAFVAVYECTEWSSGQRLVVGARAGRQGVFAFERANGF
ncbi:hypothetical protein HMPREF1249_0894 [Jonquetella sp. BV3C21]|nr:hypothetical protein HMPREF1249_0894 [Jonquetella sp. BV3C21]